MTDEETTRVPFYAIPYLGEGLPGEEELRRVQSGIMDVAEYGLTAIVQRIHALLEEPRNGQTTLELADVGALALFVADTRPLLSFLTMELDEIERSFRPLAEVRDLSSPGEPLLRSTAGDA